MTGDASKRRKMIASVMNGPTWSVKWSVLRMALRRRRCRGGATRGDLAVEVADDQAVDGCGLLVVHPGTGVLDDFQMRVAGHRQQAHAVLDRRRARLAAPDEQDGVDHLRQR